MQRFYYEQVQCRLVRRRFMIKLLVMNFLTLLLLCISFQFVAAKGLGQQVSLHYKDANMEDIFEDIHKQTGFNFFFNNSVLDGSKKVTISVEKMALEEALKLMEREQPIRFAVVGKSIVVNRAVQPAVLDTIINPQRSDDGYVLRGVVLGADDAPLSDVTIQLLRTGKGTISAASGEYTLPGVRVGDLLELRYVGYAILQVRVKELRFLEVKMQQAVSELDKVVVQGYGVTSKRFNTGNIVTVTAEEIERQPVANPLQALQGKVPGLVVSQTSGYLSAPFRVELRGRSTINPNALPEPLYIVDGVPLTVLILDPNGESYDAGTGGLIQNGFRGPAGGQSQLFSLNPDDIESISVLKDADATAIYGSRGGNGVILITTKKGKPGKVKMDISVDNGNLFIGRFYPMLNTQQYVEVRKEALRNDGITPDMTNAYDILSPNWDTTRYTNWQKEFFGGIGRSTSANVSLNGGDKNTSFRITGGFSYYTPVNSFSGSDQKISSLSNVNHRSLNSKLSIAFTNYFAQSKFDLLSLSGRSTLPPNAPPIFDANGKLNYAGWAPVENQFNFGNILSPYTATTVFVNNQGSLQYKLVDGLTVSSIFGYSLDRQSQKMLFPIASKNPRSNPTGESRFGANNSNRIIVEPQIEYKVFIGKGDLHAMIGGTYQYVNQDGNVIYGLGVVNDNLISSIENAPIQGAENGASEYKYVALFGRINYNLFKKLGITLTGRRDGSSRFAAGRNFGNFYSVGISYVFTEERLLKEHLHFISFGKIRASYGETGSDKIADFRYLTRWSGTNASPYLNQPVYLPLQHANAYLQWQEDRKIDASIQLGFFKDRVNMEVGYYRNRSGNQLLDFTLPVITGFDKVSANFPATVQNSGWEFNITGKIIEKADIGWQVYVQGGYNQNKLVSYPDIETSPYNYLYKVGEPLTIKKLFHYTGVDPQSGEYTFEDINKNGTLDGTLSDFNSDLIIKDLTVKLEGGFGSNFRFKNFDLSLGFQYRVRDGRSAYYTASFPGMVGNQSAEVYSNRWQKPGDIAAFAKLSTRGRNSDNWFMLSDGVYTNASFIRLNNAALSYSLGRSVIRKLGLRECNIFVRGQNIFVITSYKGADPEVMDFGSLSPLSSIVYGLKVSF